MEGYIFCYSLDDNVEALKDKPNTEKMEIIVRQLGTTERLLNLIENTKVAEAQGNGFWEMYTLDETLSDLVAHKAQQHKEFHNEPITQEVLTDIIGSLKNRLTESYTFLKSEYKVVKRQLKNSPSTRRKAYPNIFNKDIPEYIQKIVECILIDSSFVDLDFINDVASLNNLPGKRTRFQNELELQTINFCERLIEKRDEFKRESKTEEENKIFLAEGNKILLDEAKEFIRTRFKVELNYTFEGDLTKAIQPEELKTNIPKEIGQDETRRENELNSNELSSAQKIIIRQRNRIKTLENGLSKSELEKIADKYRKKNGKINYSAIGKVLGCTHHTAKKKCEFYTIS